MYTDVLVGGWVESCVWVCEVVYISGAPSVWLLVRSSPELLFRLRVSSTRKDPLMADLRCV